jgi:diguanylate cyclase (GGDEF)-like protein/PAS domain S-box-containing protein
MTRSGSGEDKPDQIPDSVVVGESGSINNVIDIVNRDVRTAAENIGSPNSLDRRMGAKALISAALLAEDSIEVGQRLARLLRIRGVEGQLDKDTVLHTFDEEIRKALELHEALIGGIHDIVVVLDLEDYISFVNPAITEVAGYEVDGLADMSFSQIVYADDLPEVTDRLNEAKNGINPPFEVRINCLDESVKWMLASTNILKSRGTSCGITVSMKDITRQKELEAELEKNSTHDSLTGALNRNGLGAMLADLRISRRYPISMIYIDIDGFKKFNDEHGHPAGDEVLKDVVSLLKSGTAGNSDLVNEKGLRESDIIARVGGDEFAIPLPETDAEEAAIIITRINNTFATYNDTNEDPVSISIGLSTVGIADDFDLLIKNADESMYTVKRTKQE